MIKLSIVIPAYNCEKTIENCIKSIILQEGFEKCEIIIINDGSTDDTEKIISKFINSKIKLFNQENLGVSRARNKGIELCSGEYLMFIDSDDFLKDGAIKKILNNLSNNDYEFWIYGIEQEFYKYGKLIKTVRHCAEQNKTINIAKDLGETIKLIETSLINGPYSKIFVLDILKRNNIRFEDNLKIQEDLNFNIEYLKNVDSIVLINDCVYRYIVSGTVSITTKFLLERIDNFIFVEENIFDFLKQKNIDDTNICKLYYIIVKDTWSAIINSYFSGNNFNYITRRKFIKEIINKVDYNKMKKANKSGVKYELMKNILISRNIFCIQFVAYIMYFIKSKLLVNYK